MAKWAGGYNLSCPPRWLQPKNCLKITIDLNFLDVIAASQLGSPYTLLKYQGQCRRKYSLSYSLLPHRQNRFQQ